METIHQQASSTAVSSSKPPLTIRISRGAAGGRESQTSPQNLQFFSDTETPAVMTPPAPSDHIVSISRVYANVNSEKDPSYWHYDSVNIPWGSKDNYVIIKKIGRGKYSEVFLGKKINNTNGQDPVEEDNHVVIKVLKPVKSMKIRREYKILSNLAGGTNIIQLLDAVFDNQTRMPAFIFEAMDVEGFKTLYAKFTPDDIRYYIYQLLLALDYAHSHGIMHRDVKPHNVMIDHDKRQLRLIDWGLADFYHPGVNYNVRVASRFYKGPELLVNLNQYDYGLDMWGVGCMLASMIFKKEPFFHGQENDTQLVAIAKVLGTDDLFKYLNKYSLTLEKTLLKAVGKHSKKSYTLFIKPTNAEFVSADAINLLEKLLVYDHADRLSAKEAMAHPYFDKVRMKVD